MEPKLDKAIYHKGAYVDCLDDSQRYCVAEVMEELKDKNSVRVHFIGWASRYDKVRQLLDC